MSLPTEQELAELDECLASGLRYANAEDYHAVFDKLLEAKLAELDPEWMTAMREKREAAKLPFWAFA